MRGRSVRRAGGTGACRHGCATRAPLAAALVLALAPILIAVSAPRAIGAEAPQVFTSEAPRFEVRSIDDAKLNLDTLLVRGPVLLDFWATWCRPCLRAIPELEKLHETFGARGLSVIGISADGPRNYPKVRPFARRLGVTYPIALDEDGSLQQRYQARALPTTILIAPDGRIVDVHQGYRPGEIEALGEKIEGLLEDAAEGGTDGGDAGGDDRR